LPLLFNFASVYAVREVHDNRMELKRNETHPFLFCAEDEDILGDKINTTKKDDLEVHTEKTRYTLKSPHLNVCQTHNIK
jgi:hypothetical protein